MSGLLTKTKTMTHGARELMATLVSQSILWGDIYELEEFSWKGPPTILSRELMKQVKLHQKWQLSYYKYIWKRLPARICYYAHYEWVDGSREIFAYLCNDVFATDFHPGLLKYLFKYAPGMTPSDVERFSTKITTFYDLNRVKVEAHLPGPKPVQRAPVIKKNEADANVRAWITKTSND